MSKKKAGLYLALGLGAILLLLWEYMTRTPDYRGSEGHTRGLRNNNPGNLRPLSNDKWLGEVDVDSAGPRGGYSVFAQLYYGVRAESINLIHYFSKHGWNTPRLIAQNWSPASDANDPDEKAREIANACGADVDEVLNYQEQNINILRAININEMNKADEALIPASMYVEAWADAVKHTGV